MSLVYRVQTYLSVPEQERSTVPRPIPIIDSETPTSNPSLRKPEIPKGIPLLVYRTGRKREGTSIPVDVWDTEGKEKVGVETMSLGTSSKDDLRSPIIILDSEHKKGPYRSLKPI